MNSQKAAIYYDGLCKVCSAEINHYRKQSGSEKFNFIDITGADFQAELHGIDPRLVHKVMHVRDTEGHLKQGVEAFQAIWKELPRYHFLYHLSKKIFVRWLMDFGYNIFVVIRPYLPRKKNVCADSPYCEVHNV